MKTKLYNIEFMRAVCAIGIIFYHFARAAHNEYAFLLLFKNGIWGDVFVTIFFALSGGLLYMNNNQISSIGKFYIKRFRTIYPSYYIAYIFFFAVNVYRAKMFWYTPEASPLSLVLSILGVDGYFKYMIPDYYILGEWFLGAIVMLYILYPLVLWAFNRYMVPTTILVTGLYGFVLFHNVFVIEQFRNLFTCLFSFYMGMLLFKYREVISNRIVVIISGLIVCGLLLCTVPHIPQLLVEEIFSFAMFIVLYNLGILITGFEPLKLAFNFLGGISFQIFLLQHIVINVIVQFTHPINIFDYWTMMLLSTVFTFVGAYLLKNVTTYVLKVFSIGKTAI